ncbi:MAG: WD40 repeat domain-containing protein [Bacteroidia bacterium]
MERFIILCIISFVLNPIFAQNETEKPAPIVLSGANNDLNAVAVSPIKTQRLAVAGWNNEVLIYKTDSPYQLVQKLANHSAPINSITYNLKGNMFASGGSDMNLFVYDSLFRTISFQQDQAKRHQTAIHSVMFDKASKYLFSGDKEGKLIIWDIANKKPIKMYETGNTINSIARSPSPANIFVANSDKQIKLLALVSGKILRTFDGHTDMVNALAISANSLYLISGSNDRTARIWDLKAWKPLHVLQADSWKITAVAFTDDSKYCATGANDGMVKVWEVATGKLIHTHHLPELYIKDISFTKDNAQILIGAKIKEGDNYGARLIPSSLVPTIAKEIPVSVKNKLQQDLDSIMEIRTLDRKDSIKFKSILNPQNLPKSDQAKSPTTKKTVDKPVIYKTPMKSEK